VTIDGVWIGGLIDRLCTPLGTTSTYKAIADFHTSQINIAPVKLFPVCCVLTRRSLATASISGDSSASRAQVFLSQPPVQNSCQFSTNYSAISSQPPLQSSTELVAPTLLFITARDGWRRQHPVSRVACVTVAAATWSPSRCPETSLT
jgi:hypothetical protein